MKPSASMIAAVLSACATITTQAAPAPHTTGRHPKHCPAPSAASKLYRFFQNDSAHYLYTTSAAASAHAYAAGYEFDGVAARVFKTPQPATVPLHHVSNSNSNSNTNTNYNNHAVQLEDNFYTTDVRERDAVLAGAESARDEGVAAHVFARRICGSVPLYRLFNHGTGAHFYTADEEEREQALADGGYDEPAIAGFVLAK
ncbi:hypothetical protein B0H15DRAFT_796976 [Mycena belliarum]|uniref:DUF5648 domain-containing protein n=1 Tax=Mycena belliarum TaxID=1033014 RepID=A0AAD6XS17_9AGAR|nr:hypothetical protein B0H15DRAFT_796976 [Mycena belliae]